MAVAVDSFKMLMDDVLPGFRKLEEILAFIGLFFVGKFTVSTGYDIIVSLHTHVISKLFKKNLEAKYGKWAVVTGCTDGIGKAYAEELAKNKLNLVLISRTKEKLDDTSHHLESVHGIETAIVQVNFADGASVYEKISQELAGKEIGILVNNVGVMLPHPKYFEDVSEAEIWSHVNVNIGSVLAMTKIILPGMLQRGKGAIINVASIAATGPLPFMGVYSASKAFVDYFSQALESEYSSKGITVQTLIPSYVSTKMTSFSKLAHTPSLFVPTPEQFASSALSTLGYRSHTTGYWSHGIQSWFINTFLPVWMFSYSMKMFHLFAMKGIKKQHNN